MANRSLNRVQLIGNLGRDAETTYTPSGASVTKFSIATTHRYKKANSDEWIDETNWTNIVAWQKEKLAGYLIKGKQIYVEGRLQTRSYDDKEGRKVYTTEVISEDIMLLGGGQGADGEHAKAASSGAAGRSSAPPPSGFTEELTDDDIPDRW